MRQFKNKSKSRKSKKSKKPSKKSSNEWNFEGGQFKNNDSEGKEVMKGRRKTQDFDERMRRGRRKMMQNELKSAIVRKLSKKVSFLDNSLSTNSVTSSSANLNKSKHSDNDENRINDENNVKKKLMENLPQDPNQILSQLQTMLKQTKTSISIESRTNGNKNSSEYSNIDIQTRNAPEKIDSDFNLDEKITMVEEDVLNHHDKDDMNTLQESELDDDDDDDDESHSHLSINTASNYHLYSSKPSDPFMKGVDSDSLTILKAFDIEGYEVYGPEKITELSFRQVFKYGDLSYLPKLWKNRANTKIKSVMENSLMSVLNQYYDVFIERSHYQRDLSNDTEILQAFLFHIATHVVRARYYRIY
jgi:hypothetical protein